MSTALTSRLRASTTCLALSTALLCSWPARAGAEPPSSETSPESSGTAASPDDQTVALAREHFDRGLELHRDGDAALALIEFNRAFQLVPNYRVLYNIGQVSIQLGHYADARRAFSAYLEQGGVNVPHERVESVSADLRMLETRTAYVTITTNIVGAEVLVDEVSVGDSPLAGPLLLDAGQHRVRISKVGFTPWQERIVLAGRDNRALNAELQAETAASTRTIVVREQGERSRYGGLLIAGWVATGVLVTGAAVTGVLGADKADELERLRRTEGDDSLRQDLSDASSSARSWLLASDILSGTALAAGAASLWYTLARPNVAAKGPEDAVKVSWGLGSVTVSGRF